MRGGHRGHAAKLVSAARELIDGYDGQRKSAIQQMKVALEEKMAILQTMDGEIQGIICAGESSDEALMEDIEAAAKIAIDGVGCMAAGSSEAAREITNSQGSPITVTGTSSQARLPKLEIKKFSGRIHECQEFWDSFRSAIHNNASLSDVDKFSYLRGLIDGPAKATIAGFALTAENYTSAVEHLTRRFGKPVAIERAHVSELLKVVPVYGEKDVRGLRTLYDTVDTHYRGLSALGIDESTYSGIVVPTLLEKIPDAVRSRSHLRLSRACLLVYSST